MKNKKAFTLIELIAVLVIMAIIALIVTPLVMSIIRKSITAADKRSVDAYGRSIDIAIANYILEHAEFPNDIASLNIEYSGSKVECGIMALNEDAGAYLSECKVGNRDVKDSSTNDGWYHYEAKNMASLDYKVGDEVTYNGIKFQVIKNSKTADDTVTLIKSVPLTSAELTELGFASAADITDVDGYAYVGSENVYSVQYAGNYLKSVVDTWASDNSLLVNINDEARLISNSELTNNLKYSLSGVANVAYVHSFENSPVIWSASHVYWSLNDAGTYAHHSVFVPAGSNDSNDNATVGAYIRPVIEIAKSNLE